MVMMYGEKRNEGVWCRRYVGMVRGMIDEFVW